MGRAAMTRSVQLADANPGWRSAEDASTTAVAFEHCSASSVAETRWDRIVSAYDLLAAVAPSPLHALNRLVALAEWQGGERALAELEALAVPVWLERRYEYAAVRSDLHRRCGHAELATAWSARALALAPTPAIRALLARRFRVSALSAALATPCESLPRPGGGSS